MQKYKLSVGRSMGLMVLIAANLALVRRAFVASEDIEFISPEGIESVSSFGVMLMGNVLVLGTFRLVTVPHSRHPFVLGFLAYGAISLAVFIACAMKIPVQVASSFAWANELINVLSKLLRQIIPTLYADYLKGMTYAMVLCYCFYAATVPILVMLIGLPQIALATLGGLLSWRIARVAASE